MMRKASKLSTASLHAQQAPTGTGQPLGDQPATATLFAIALAVIPIAVLLAVLASLFSQLDIEAALRSGFGKWAQLS